MSKKIKNNKGSGILEVLFGSAIVAFVIFSLIGAYIFYIRQGAAGLNRTQATLLVEEGVEAIRTLRDTSWASEIAPLATSTDYRISFESGFWTATTALTYVDSKFDRRFRLDDVYRDSDGDIENIGTYDSGSRRLTVSVAWRAPEGTTTKSLVVYLTNLFSN